MITQKMIYILVFLLLLYILFVQRFDTYNLMDEFYNNEGILTTKIQNYPEIFKHKIDYLKTFNLDQNILKLFEELPPPGIAELTVISSIIPGNNFGYNPMIPYTNTDQKVCLQIEQGFSGWYWLYGTFANTKDSFLYCLTRTDILPSTLRKKTGHKLGDTTVYCLVLCVGDGKSFYHGKIYFEGSLTIKNNLNFSIISNDNNVFFNHDSIGINAGVKNIIMTENQTDKQLTFNFVTSCSNNSLMLMNQPQGCQPCLLLNNSYQSYTNLKLSMVYSNQLISKNLSGGVGWMDHEWGGGEIDSLGYNLILNILNKGKNGGTLPPYIWLTVRLNDNIQYMIFSLLSAVPSKGDTIKCYINKYYPTGTLFSTGDTIDVIILENFNFKGTDYPIKYKFEVDGKSFILDSTPFGVVPVFRDILHYNHFGGSAILYNTQMIEIGTGFIEAYRFEEGEKSLTDVLTFIKAKNPSEFAKKYLASTNMYNYIGSYMIIILMICLIFKIIYGYF